MVHFSSEQILNKVNLHGEYDDDKTQQQKNLIKKIFLIETYL